jgi:hypothetical protein
MLSHEGSSNSLDSPAPTRRRLQPPNLQSLIRRKLKLLEFFISNLKEDMTPYILRLQLEGGYNPLSLSLPSSLKYKCRLNLSLFLSLIHHHNQNQAQPVIVIVIDHQNHTQLVQPHKAYAQITNKIPQIICP